MNGSDEIPKEFKRIVKDKLTIGIQLRFDETSCVDVTYEYDEIRRSDKPEPRQEMVIRIFLPNLSTNMLAMYMPMNWIHPIIIDDSLALSDEPDDLKMSAVYDNIVTLPENAAVAIKNRPMRSPRTEAFSAEILIQIILNF